MVRRSRTISSVHERIAFFQVPDKFASSDQDIDANNNDIEPEHKVHCESVPGNRDCGACRSSTPVNRRSYIPSYVRSVERQGSSADPEHTDISERLARRASHVGTCYSRKYSGQSVDYGTYEPSQSLIRLREKYRRNKEPKVHVKDAIRAMEAKLKSNPPPVTPKTKIRQKFHPSVMQRKAKHRRSMSDPNLHKTFRQVKQLWDQKVESEKKPNGTDSRSGSISSVSSIGSYKSLDRKSNSKDSNESLNGIKSSSAVTVKATSVKFSPPKKEPPVPPRPATRRPARSRATTLNKIYVEPVKDESSDMASSATETLSVSEKALLFGGGRKKSYSREDKQEQSKPQSPAFQRHRRSWSDDSIDRSLDSDKQSTDDTHIYDEVPYTRQRNTSEITNTYKPVSQLTEADEENVLVNNLQKNANQARERRRKRGSTDSSTPASDEEDGGKRSGSFLHNVRRRSKDNAKSLPKQQSLSPSPKQSPLAILKTEETIFGGPAAPKDNNQILADEAEFKGRRRASSLHRLMEQNLSGSNLSLNSLSSGGSPKLKRLDESRTEQNTKSQSGDVQRPTRLNIPSRRERSKTEGAQGNTGFPDQQERSGSLNQLTSISASASLDSISPSTPDKQSSGFSDVDSMPGSEILIIKSPPPQPPPKSTKPMTCPMKKVESTERGRAGAISISSVDSAGTQGSNTPIGEFNLVAEYDKIAQSINEPTTAEPSSQSKPVTSGTSEECATESVDSGFRNSLEVPSNSSSSRGVNVDSWSDFDNSDEDDNSLGTPSKQLDVPRIPSPSPSLKETTEVKLRNIANELLSTEESYVAVLHLIDQVFHKQVLDAAVQKHIMPEAVVNNIFCHVPAIYQFHSSFLLPQLRQRLQNWETNPRIGDIMTRAAPFLKMYSLYVQHFDEAMNTIKTWSEKSREFSAIIKSIQKLPECNFLTLQHHMLGPVQRVPRYRMLLHDYVKRLPEDAEDKQEAATALELITVAATHSNETMKKIEKFHKLVNVFNGLADVNFDIVDVSRELLKEGKIIKISARNGEKYERYLYLFSDMLLCCTPLGRLQGKSYKVTAKIDLDGMKVTEVKNPTVSYAFCVHGLQKSMEFATNSADDKVSWIQAINGAIDESIDRMQTFIMKKGSFRGDQITQEDGVSPQNGHAENSPIHLASPLHQKQPLIAITDADLGTRAPRWIKDHEVTICMSCSKAFNKLLRRRHHCRACGRVVCSECSEHKTMLQYDPGKPLKVCGSCYNVLTGRHQNDSSDGEKKGVLEVEADAVSEHSVIADYLFFTENEKKKTWTKTWCVIPNNELCLYFYGAHQDVRAQMTMPLPGFEVIEIASNEHKYCFKLKQARKVLLFASNDRACIDRWKYALKQASIGEDLTRDDVYRLGQPKESSESSADEGPVDYEETERENPYDAITPATTAEQEMVDDDEFISDESSGADSEEVPA